MFNVWTIHMSNICDKTRASLRQRRWEWLDDVELVQRGHCNYRLNSACPPFLLSSNWKPLLYPSCKTEGQLHSVEQCNEKLGGSCSGGHQQQQQESIEGRGWAREKLTGNQSHERDRRAGGGGGGGGGGGDHKVWWCNHLNTAHSRCLHFNSEEEEVGDKHLSTKEGSADCPTESLPLSLVSALLNLGLVHFTHTPTLR